MSRDSQQSETKIKHLFVPDHLEEIKSKYSRKSFPGFRLKYLVMIIPLLIAGFYFSKTVFYRSDNASHVVCLKAPCPDFVGRVDLLKQLYNELLAGQKITDFHKSVKIKELWGKGGIGKSELAVQFANQYLERFFLVWTFDCDTQEHVEQGYRQLAEQLGILNEKELIEKIVKNVHFYLENSQSKLPWLLIYDNVEEFLPDYPQRGGVILITSQKKVLRSENIIEVGSFSKEESIQLFEKIAQEKRGEAMEQLADTLDSIPLLINYAAHYIKATPGCDVAAYQKIFSAFFFAKDGPLWQDVDVNQRYFKSLVTSWQFPLKSLEKQYPLALEWLYVCSYLYPERILESWIDGWLAQKSLSSERPVEIERKEILKSLQRYGIIRYEEKTQTFSLHRFFQYMLREYRKSYFENDLSQVVSILAKQATSYRFAESSSWQSGAFWYSHACELRKWLNIIQPQFNADTQIEESVFYQGIAEWCNYHNRFPEALDANCKALNLLKNNKDSHALDVGSVYVRIGWILFQLGRYEEALTACQEAKKIQDQLLDKHAIGHAENLHTQGLIFLEQGKYEEALTCHRQALEIRLKNYGELHVDVGRSYHNIAVTLRELSQYQEVLKFHEKALTIFQKICGKNHPLYIRVLQNKGWVIFDQGHYEEALKLFQEGLALNLAILGKKHGNLAYSYNGIGWCNYRLGNLKIARKAFKKAMQIGLENHGESARSVIRAYKGLAWSYVKSGNVEKGLRYFVKEIEGGAKAYQNSPKTIAILKDFQKALEEIKELGASSEVVKIAAAKAHEISKKTLGLDHPVTLEFSKIES